MTEEELCKHYQNVFGGESGEIVLSDLMQRANYFTDEFNPDPYHQAYNVGLKAFVKLIQDNLSKTESSYWEMHRKLEAQNAESHVDPQEDLRRLLKGEHY